jgi:hypothetical protein
MHFFPKLKTQILKNMGEQSADQANSIFFKSNSWNFYHFWGKLNLFYHYFTFFSGRIERGAANVSMRQGTDNAYLHV